MLAAGGLLVASAAALLVRFLTQFPWQAFVGSMMVVPSIWFLVDFWRSRRAPDPTIPRWNGRHFIAFMDGIGVFYGSYLLILAWRESPALAAGGMALSLLVLAISFAYRWWRVRQGGQTPDSNPPAVTAVTK